MYAPAENALMHNALKNALCTSRTQWKRVWFGIIKDIDAMNFMRICMVFLSASISGKVGYT